MQDEQPGGEGDGPAGHGGQGGAPHSVGVDEQGIEDQDQSVGEEGEPHGVRVSPAPLRIPSRTLTAKKTAVPGSEIAK